MPKYLVTLVVSATVESDEDLEGVRQDALDAADIAFADIPFPAIQVTVEPA